MNTPPTKQPLPPTRPWWWRNRSQVAVLVLVVIGLLLANSLLAWVWGVVWLAALALLSAWLLGPDLLWAWREHPATVRRVLRFMAHPRTIRGLLYLLLAYAWWVTLF